MQFLCMYGMVYICITDSDSIDTDNEMEVWEEEIEDFNETFEVDDQISVPHPLILWIVYFIALLQKKHYIPNTAISLLLKFLYTVFMILSKTTPNLEFFKQFPKSFYQMQKILDTKTQAFQRYVVCEKCSSIYEYDSCLEIIGTRRIPKLCKHKASQYAVSCNGELLRSISLLSGKIVFYPRKVFCFMSLRQYFSSLLNRTDFINLCNHWKELPALESSNVYNSVYDGKIWKSFSSLDGGRNSFLSHAHSLNFGLMLNIDWFKPCKHSEYSVGVIYLTIMNLPRKLRFKQENVLLIGLIPGPKEPKQNLNSMLHPLVQELLKFWEGINMYDTSSCTSLQVWCALLCVACDIPASRKVCGFLAHSASHGCSKCLKRFPGGVGEKDYSGFVRSDWPKRTVEEHRKNVCLIKNCTTLAERKKLETLYGCRYSCLLDLPYFDPISMTIIDPMHNLYLGTAKHMLQIWIDQRLISKNDMQTIQKFVDSVQTPQHVGRIPYKIFSSFSGFTADQYKNWTNVYSLMALKDILPTQHLECWHYFVLASRLICKMIISSDEIELADALLVKFCRKVEELYGNSVITPNMHLHCHLKESLYNYGPVYNFWLYSYERYNGILEHFPSSNCLLEIQMMHRFFNEFKLYTAINKDLSSETYPELYEIFNANIDPSLSGSLHSTTTCTNDEFLTQSDVRSISDWRFSLLIEQLVFPPSYVCSSFDCSLQLELKNTYALLYPNVVPAELSVNATFKKYRSIEYKGISYSAKKCLIVFATKLTDLRNVSSNLKPCALLIHYFALHGTSSLHESICQHLFAVGSWLNETEHKEFYGKPLELWCRDYCSVIFVPIQLIQCHAVYTTVKHDLQDLYLTCPVKHIPLFL